MTVTELNHKLNQLQNGLMKLESDVSTIYNYIDSLSNKNYYTYISQNPSILKTVLSNTQKALP